MTQRARELPDELHEKAKRQNQELFVQKKIRATLETETRQRLSDWFRLKPSIDKARYHALLNEARQTFGRHFRVDLTNLVLRDRDLSDMDLENANLFNTDLQHTDLRNTNLKHAILHETNFEQSKMSGCQLDCAKIWRANFRGVDIDPVDMSKNYTIFKKAYEAGSTLPSGHQISWDHHYGIYARP